MKERAYEIINCTTEEVWKIQRMKGIGGSDAASILGLNPWKTNTQLYREKVGAEMPPDISDEPAVWYGKNAEIHLIGLFELDYPAYKVEIHPMQILTSKAYPYMQATLDGYLTEQATEREGILEIKTTTIRNSADADKWRDEIPDNYYCQCLHYLAVTGFDFVKLRALLRHPWGDNFAAIRDYTIEREEVVDDIEELVTKEKEFWWSVEKKDPPALILPRI